MNKTEIKEKLIELCAEIFQNSNIDKDLIEFVDFVDDLGMDSITFITLIVEIEALFNIQIPDDLLIIENFRNVDDVIQIISEQLLGKVLEKED